MFKFAGYLDCKQFCRASALRIGLFLASVVGFPFFLLALAEATSCRSVGGACGAIGVIGAMMFKPLAFVLFAFSFVGISMRRVRDAGAPGWIGLFIPLLLAASHTFLVFFGAPWSFAFASGVLTGSFPRFTLLALVCIAVLCALPSRGDSPTSHNPFGRAGLVAFGLGLFVAAFAALAAVSGFPGAAPFAYLMGPLLRPAAPFVPYAMVGFAALLAWIAWSERRHVSAEPTRSAPDPQSGPALPNKSLLAFALIATIVAFKLALPNDLSLPVAFLTQLTTTIMFESPNATGIRAVWTVPGIEHVIAKGAYSSRLMQFDRPPDRGPWPAPRAVDAPPSEYLLLKVGRASSFAKKQQVYATVGGPLELRLVDSRRNDLIAVWYHVFNPRPSVMPLLTTAGWYRGSNSATTDDVAASIAAFLARALNSSR